MQLKFNPFPPIPAKTVPLSFNTPSKDRRFGLSRESLALGRKGLTGPIWQSFSLNHFPPRPAKTVPLLFLLYRTPDNFGHQKRTSGWKMVNWGLGKKGWMKRDGQIGPVNPFPPRGSPLHMMPNIEHYFLLLCLFPGIRGIRK